MNSPAEFTSPDGQYNLRIEPQALDRIFELGRDRSPRETGGILVGAYTDSNSVAEVRKILGPPPDSREGTSYFIRGKRGLSERLEALWEEGLYFLGEWHTHPKMPPRPSLEDILHMRSIHKDSRYQCEAPLLAIAGGELNRSGLRAYVFPPNASPIELEGRTSG